MGRGTLSSGGLLLLLLFGLSPALADNLTALEAQRYIQLRWSSPHLPVAVELPPTQNLSPRPSAPLAAATQGLEAERGHVPLAAIDALWQQLLRSSGVYAPGEPARYRITLAITDYQPRYASATTGWLGHSLEWSKELLGIGDEEPSRAAIRVELYEPGETVPLKSLNLRAALRECETLRPVSLSSTGAAVDPFLNTYSRSAIGQVMLALLNKALTELVGDAGPVRAHGLVSQVARGELTLALDEADIGEELSVIHPASPASPPYPVGKIRITGGTAGRYLAVPIDLALHAIVVGDRVRRERIAPATVYSSMPGSPGYCDDGS